MQENYSEPQIRTPWGQSQVIYNVAPGIIFASTASHGGFKLDRALNAQVPAEARKRGGWYEENCEWAIPFLTFPEIFEEAHDEEQSFEELQQIAVDTLRMFCPNAYEYIMDDTLGPGDSWKWDRDHGIKSAL